MSIYSRLYRCRTLSIDGEHQSSCSTVVNNSRLLDLPRELRDEILSYLLEERTEAPRHPPYGGRRQKLHDVHVPPYRRFRYPPAVWVCRQLRSECFDLAFKRSASGRVEAELDILFKGYLSWPTWTYLPPLLPRENPFDLTVTLRIFSTEAFRSNDGWPRQPGTAFRDLLWMLNTLLHNGPSFMSNIDSNGLYRINKLTVIISFHDDYTTDTHPETAHNIFKCLKELAMVGLTSNIVKTVEAHTAFHHRGKNMAFDGKWDTPEQSDAERFTAWNDMGFFCPAQIYSRSRYPTSHSV